MVTEKGFVVSCFLVIDKMTSSSQSEGMAAFSYRQNSFKSIRGYERKDIIWGSNPETLGN